MTTVPIQNPTSPRPSATRGRHPKSRWGTTEQREWLLFALLVGPNLLLFSVFTYWPLIYNAYLSFVRWDLLSPVKIWVGIDNYTYLVNAPEFGRIMGNTLIFTLGSVAILCTLGLVMALLLNQPLRGRTSVRAIVFSPVMLSGAAIGLVWIYILDPRYGLLDIFIRAVGLRSPNWLLDTQWAMSAVIMVHVWKNVGYAVVIYLAGLQAIPRELYEVALVDGAGSLRTLWAIVLPLAKPALISFGLLSIVSKWNEFLWPLLVTNTRDMRVLSIGIYWLRVEEGTIDWGVIMAGTLFVVLPVAIIFLYAQRYIVEGIAAGAVKG